MKKFLSLLLALTMVMSLVVVPANATTGEETYPKYTVEGNVSVTASQSTVASGTEVTFTADTSAIKLYKQENATSERTEVTDATFEYSWNGATAGSDKKTANQTFTTSSGSETKNVSCTVTVLDGTSFSKELSASTTVTVTNAQAAFESSITAIKYDGRSYTITKNGDNWTAEVKYVGETAPTTGFSTNVSGVTATLSGTTLNLSNGTLSKTLTLTLIPVTLAKPTISVKSSTVHTDGATNYIRVGEKGQLELSYTSVLGTSESSLSYRWKDGSNNISNATSKTVDLSGLSVGTHSITVVVTDSGNTVTSETYTLVVREDTYTVSDYSGYSNKMTPGQSQTLSIRVKNNGTPVDYPEYTVVWTSSNTQVAKFNNATAKEGVLVAQNKTGETTVTAKVTYLNKEYDVSFGKIQVNAADATLNDLKNGSYDYLSDSELKSVVADAINKVSSSTVRSSDISTIKVSSYPAHVTLYKNSKSSSNKLSGSSLDLTTIDDLYYEADAGYIGKDELVLDVKLTEVGSSTITVTLYIPVVAESEIKETVTGTSTSSAVTFTNEAYASLYYTYSKTTDFSGYYTGRRVDGWTLASKNDPITVAANKFDSDGKVTLYVVGLDKDGVASTGTIEVSQKSYTIEYNVVAGESVTFNQADFEELFKEYAEDNGDQSAKRDYPYVEYSHVELTSSALPATKNEGDLYYGSTVLTSKNIKNEKFEDMDKMSFTAISKIKKDTVTIPVTLVGTKYTKSSDKTGDPARYPVSVVISVVNEDIKYTVGVNDSVTFDAKDFADYLNDYQTSYKKSTLDYVEFSLGRNSIVGYTSGALYQSYSTYYAGELAESSDKFYYEPSKKQLDLDEVTYVTTKWAEAGKTVYIPFTVYGTKNEKAEGTVAIEIKNAMNFTDVVQGRDYFYDSVQWAVNNDITNGTSTTTFSPLLGCTRAQIVTFLWRAAGSPEPTSSKNPFKDVNSVTHADYYKAILWAVSKGITDGTTPTTFSPDATCTRAQIVTFLYRYANSPATYGSLSFKDVSKTTHSAYYNAILWAVNKNITTGNGNNTFAPEQTCNRAEAVTFLYRYFN